MIALTGQTMSSIERSHFCQLEIKFQISGSLRTPRLPIFNPAVKRKTPALTFFMSSRTFSSFAYQLLSNMQAKKAELEVKDRKPFKYEGTQ